MTTEAAPGGASTYHAFISYSHAQDSDIAESLQRELQRFGVAWYRLRAAPPSEVAERPLRPLRVFRDVTNLTATPGLWPMICEALASSEWFILMASPAAARSDWVRQELAWWLANRSVERILIVWTSGHLRWARDDFDWEVTTAVPAELAGRFSQEPRWIDWRPLRPTTAAIGERIVGQGRRRSPRLKLGDIVAELAAPIRRMAKDSLVGFNVQQRRRTLRTVQLVIAGLSTLAITATVAAVVALEQRATAVEQRNTALANQMVAEAASLEATQPGRSRQMIAAARHVKLTPQVSAALVGSPAIAQEIHVAAEVLALSGDGQLVVAARRGRTRGTLSPRAEPPVNAQIRLYDAASFRVIFERELEAQPIYAAAFSPAPAHLLAVAYGHEIQVWDVADPSSPIVHPLGDHPANVMGLSFRSDGRVLASVSRDGELRLWDLDRDPQRGALSVTSLGITVASCVLQFQPGRDRIGLIATELSTGAWSGLSEPQVTGISEALWDKVSDFLFIDARDTAHPSVTHAAIPAIRKFAFSEDGRHLVTASNIAVQQWQIDGDGKLSEPVNLPMRSTDFTIARLAYSARSQAAAVSEDGHVLIWDLTSPAHPELTAELAVPRHDSQNTDAFVFSPDGMRLAMLSPGSNAGPDGAGTQAGTVRMWNVADSRERRAFAVIPAGVSATSVDGRLLARVEDGVVRLVDIADPRQPRVIGSAVDLERANLRISKLAFSPDAKLLAAAYNDDAVFVLDLKDPQRPVPIAVWKVTPKPGTCDSPALPRGIPCGTQVTTLAFLGDHTLVAGDVTAQISLFDIPGFNVDRPDGNTAIEVLPSDGMPIALDVVSRDGRQLLIAAVLLNYIKIWDVTAPGHSRLLATTAANGYELQDLASSPDGRFLTSVGRDGAGILWSIDDDGRLHRLTGINDTGDIHKVAISPSGRLLATSGRDNVVRVYDLSAGRPVLTTAINNVNVDAVAGVQFLGNEHTLATGSRGGLDIWELDPDENVRRLCAGIGAELTRAQWRRDVPGLPYDPPCAAGSP